jgi:hypothetical protein
MKFFIPLTTVCCAIVLFASFLPVTAPKCSSVHAGKFYFYAKRNDLKLNVVRADSLQTETDYKTGKTSTWKIQWLNDCTFNCNYKAGLQFRSDDEAKFYQKSNLVFNILHVTDDYYTYQAEHTYEGQSTQSTDTMWRREK